MSAITYTQCGDYLIPNISISEEEAELPPLTKWGRMRMDYLKDHRPILYNDMKLSGKLFLHCHEIEEQAEERKRNMMAAISKDPANRVTERDKAQDPMAWVGRMNNFQASVLEIIYTELIYG